MGSARGCDAMEIILIAFAIAGALFGLWTCYTRSMDFFGSESAYEPPNAVDQLRRKKKTKLRDSNAIVSAGLRSIRTVDAAIPSFGMHAKT